MGDKTRQLMQVNRKLTHSVVQMEIKNAQKIIKELRKEFKDDAVMSPTLEELFGIYEKYKGFINKGESKKDGEVGFKDGHYYAEINRKSKTVFLHELTHLAQIKSLLGEDLTGDPQNAKEILEKAPLIDYTSTIGKWLDEIKNISNVPSKALNYIRDRLLYAATFQYEQPSVVVDLYCYMSEQGYSDNFLFSELQMAVSDFYRGRELSRKGYEPIPD